MKLFYALFLFLSITLNAEVRDSINVDSLYLNFNVLAYNFDFDNAEQVASKLINDFPQSPYGYHAEALLNMWYFMGSRDDGDAKVFLEFSDLALQRFEKYYEQTETPLSAYRIGEEYMFRTIVFLFLHKQVKSFWNLKKAVSYFKLSNKLDNTFVDGYLGIGLFEYSLVYAPSALKVGLFLVGLSADAKKGISDLKVAVNSGRYSRDEAEFQLSKIYSDYYFNINKSNKYLIPLLKKYPGNIFFKYQYSINLIKDKQLTLAEQQLDRIVKYSNKHFMQLKAFSYFLKGEVKFTQNDFPGAIENYKNFFQFARSAEFLGYANYKDKRASIISLHYLENNLQNVNLALIYARNLIESGKYSEALDALDTTIVKSDIEKKEKFLLSAEAFIELKDYRNAKLNLTKAEYILIDDNYWNTYLLYLYSKYFLETNKPVEFNNYYEKAKESDCGSFELKAKIMGLGEQ